MKLSELANEIFGKLGYTTIFACYDGVNILRESRFKSETLLIDISKDRIEKSTELRWLDGEHRGTVFHDDVYAEEKEAYYKFLKMVQADTDGKIDRSTEDFYPKNDFRNCLGSIGYSVIRTEDNGEKIFAIKATFGCDHELAIDLKKGRENGVSKRTTIRTEIKANEITFDAYLTEKEREKMDIIFKCYKDE